MENFLEAIGVFVVAVILDTLAAIIFVLYWGWFIVPVFHLGQITILQSLGLIFTISMFSPAKKKEISITDMISEKLTSFIVFLLIGWVLSLLL